MKSWLLIPVLLGCALAAPPTELRAKGGVIYNDAAMDSGTVRDWVYGPALTFEVRLDTVEGWHFVATETRGNSSSGYDDWGKWPEWNLYVTQTIGDTVRRFRVARLELIEEVP